MLTVYLSVACFSLLWPTDLFRSTMPYLLLTALCRRRDLFRISKRRPGLGWRDLRFPLGEISSRYSTLDASLSLKHGPLLEGGASRGLPAPWTLPFYLLAAGAVAYLSYRFFE